MSSSAKVKSIAALDEFRQAFAEAGEEADRALSAVDMEIRRVIDWLEREQAAYWQQQLKIRREEVSQARTELARRRLQGITGDMPDCSEQQDALRTAKRRMEQAEEKIEAVRHWHRVVQQAVLEYQGKARQLASYLVTDLPRGLARLERMVQSLEAYVSLAAPTDLGAEERASVARVGETPLTREDSDEKVGNHERQ
jgi:hypothetical protein